MASKLKKLQKALSMIFILRQKSYLAGNRSHIKHVVIKKKNLLRMIDPGKRDCCESNCDIANRKLLNYDTLT